MSDARDFSFFVEDDLIRVRHVVPKTLARISSGQNSGADYSAGVIRILRGESRRARRGYLLHELGHYLESRLDMGRRLTDEDACDMLAWLPTILIDDRNSDLRKYLGLRLI